MHKFKIISIHDRKEYIEKELNKLKKKFKDFEFNVTTQEKDNKIIYTFNLNNGNLKQKEYTYKLSLQKSDTNENFIFNSKEKNIEKYKNIEFRCDHCNTNRYRTKVDIFTDIKTNQELMIASSCVKEYFGINVHNYVNTLLYLNTKIAQLNDGEESIYSKQSKFNPETIAKLSYYVIKEQKNYVPQSKETELKQSTTTIVTSILKDKIPNTNFDFSKYLKFWEKKTLEDNNNTFFHNINLNNKMFNCKIGFMTYGVYVYMKEELNIFGEKKTYKSEYQYNIKDKFETKLILKNQHSFNTQYGTTTIYKFIDNHENVFIWFSSNDKNLKIDEQYTVKGSIKDHKEYNNEKQTLITRCKIPIDDKIINEVINYTNNIIFNIDDTINIEDLKQYTNKKYVKKELSNNTINEIKQRIDNILLSLKMNIVKNEYNVYLHQNIKLLKELNISNNIEMNVQNYINDAKKEYIIKIEKQKQNIICKYSKEIKDKDIYKILTKTPVHNVNDVFYEDMFESEIINIYRKLKIVESHN